MKRRRRRTGAQIAARGEKKLFDDTYRTMDEAVEHQKGLADRLNKLRHLRMEINNGISELESAIASTLNDVPVAVGARLNR